VLFVKWLWSNVMVRAPKNEIKQLLVVVWVGGAGVDVHHRLQADAT